MAPYYMGNSMLSDETVSKMKCFPLWPIRNARQESASLRSRASSYKTGAGKKKTYCRFYREERAEKLHSPTDQVNEPTDKV